MPWMPKKAVEKSVASMLINMEDHRMIAMKTKKKDRTVSIKKEKNNYRIYEDGFRNENFLISDQKNLKKTLKELIEIEFPRSHEILVTNQEWKD